MNVFPISSDDYSVEEISYEDMMSILSSQKHALTDFQPVGSNTPDKTDTHVINKPVPTPTGDNCSQRIAENAKQSLPGWLVNN